MQSEKKLNENQIDIKVVEIKPYDVYRVPITYFMPDSEVDIAIMSVPARDDLR